LLPLLVVLIY